MMHGQKNIKLFKKFLDKWRNITKQMVT